MKTFQRMLGMLLIVIASAGLVVACGDDEGEECIDSNDCATGEVCNLDTGQCGFACDSADDPACIDDEVCDFDATSEADLGVCVAPDEPGDECTIDEDCPTEGDICEGGVCVPEEQPECTTNEDCGDEGICVDGTCDFEQGVTYQYAWVQDASEGEPALCGDVNDPGSDLFAVELRRDVDGETVSYWARTEFDHIENEGNNHTNTGILDGEAPDFGGACPESFSGNVVALGCGGSIFVQFMDDEGNFEPIQDGDTITVHEWGATCQTQGGGNAEDLQDSWQVEVCAVGSAIDLEEPECDDNITVGGGSGIADVTVDLP